MLTNCRSVSLTKSCVWGASVASGAKVSSSCAVHNTRPDTRAPSSSTTSSHRRANRVPRARSIHRFRRSSRPSSATPPPLREPALQARPLRSLALSSTASAWSRSSPVAARPGPRPALAFRRARAPAEVSARGFAWRENPKAASCVAGRHSPAPGSLPVLALAAGTRPVARVARLVADPRRRRAVRTAASAGTARAWSRPLPGRCAPWGRARRGPFGAPRPWLQSVRPARPGASLPVSGLRPVAVKVPRPPSRRPPRGAPCAPFSRPTRQVATFPS